MKIYIQVAEGTRSMKVRASTSQPVSPLNSSGYSNAALPTITFAIEVNIAPELFEEAIATVAEFELRPDNITTNSPQVNLVQGG